MKKEKQKTLHEKWEIDSREPDGGIGFGEASGDGKMIPMIGFTDEQLKKILGEEKYKKYKEQFDEIEEA